MKLHTPFNKAFVAAVCLMTTGPTLLFASGTQKPAAQRGIIKSVDANSHQLVVTERRNAEQKFTWNDQTRFSEGKKTVTASTLKTGERVLLTYAPGGDTPVLQSVRIARAKAKSSGA